MKRTVTKDKNRRKKMINCEKTMTDKHTGVSEWIMDKIEII